MSKEQKITKNLDNMTAVGKYINHHIVKAESHAFLKSLISVYTRINYNAEDFETTYEITPDGISIKCVPHTEYAKLATQILFNLECEELSKS